MEQKIPTLDQIKAVIPKHCFERNQLRFLWSIAKTLLIMAPVFYLATFIPVEIIWLPVWGLYGLIGGTIMTGLWVLGHECGHNAFSSNPYLNHTVGYILHSVLLVPYFSWKWSHYVHHNKNNHIFEGETHVPVVYDEKKCATIIKLHHYLGKLTPTFQAIAYLGPGWILYLLIGATGGPGRGKTNHFIVPNGLFPASKVAEVHFSTFGVILTLIGLYQLGKIYTFSYVFLLYFPVWTAVNMYLTTITLLQHTEKNLKWYDDRKWQWVKGALNTIDRNYPYIIDQLQYHIGTTHVAHHLFSQIPHYHAQQATIAIKNKIGKLYKRDQTPFYKAFYESCKLYFVYGEGDGNYHY